MHVKIPQRAIHLLNDPNTHDRIWYFIATCYCLAMSSHGLLNIYFLIFLNKNSTITYGRGSLYKANLLHSSQTFGISMQCELQLTPKEILIDDFMPVALKYFVTGEF